MRTTSIFTLLFVIVLAYQPLHGQRFLDASASTSIGYSAGRGQGISFILERLSEADQGEFGLSAVVNVRSIPIQQGDQYELVIAGRVNYHPWNLMRNERFDPYGFATLGIGLEDIDNTPQYMGTREEGQRQFTAWGFGAGLRYRVYNSFGVFTELSYGTGLITVGLNWRAF
jgi:hypothetical protein